MRTVYCVAMVFVISLGMTSAGMGHGQACGHSSDLGAEACSAPNYGTLDLAPGCCEYPPNCCKDVWAGYCQERDDWKEFVPRRWRHKQDTCACGATRPCRPGFCPFFSLFGWALPTATVSTCDEGPDPLRLEVILEVESELDEPTLGPAPEPPSI